VDAAGVEVLLGGLVVEAVSPVVVAVGGTTADIEPVSLSAGERLAVPRVQPGLRRYLAVAGGIAAPPFLGSRSTDLLTGLGPPPLEAGDVLTTVDSAADAVAVKAPALPDETGTVVRLHPGPRVDWFEPEAVGLLGTSLWSVTPESNRTAARLAGPPLPRRRVQELPPEALRPGAVQVPPSGQPLVFLSEHPATGGYPVIGVVDPADLRLVAQTRPGRTLRFSLPARGWER
jgi:biotin-dependent carboxylase-like uncharacterized protein